MIYDSKASATFVHFSNREKNSPLRNIGRNSNFRPHNLMEATGLAPDREASPNFIERDRSITDDH